MKVYRVLIDDKTRVDLLPHGAGIDGEYYVEYNQKKDRLRICNSLHVMNDLGFYVKWVPFEVIVTPSLKHEIELKIRGKLPAIIKEDLYSLFYDVLTEEIDE